MSNFTVDEKAITKATESPALRQKNGDEVVQAPRASDGQQKAHDARITVGDGSKRPLSQETMGNLWNGGQQLINPNQLVGKWIEVQGYGTCCVTSFNKVTRMEAIMMKNSTHTVRLSKSGTQEDLVLSRYKGGELNKGHLWYFLYLEEQEKAMSESKRRGSMVGK